MLEVEVKVKIDNQNIEAKLIELGFKRGVKAIESDTYFNGNCKDLKAEDKALRIRETRAGDISEITLNYKGPKVDDKTMTREEIEFNVPLEDGFKLLAGLGYKPAGEVIKERQTFILDECTCCLDNVKDLGEFLEIEIIAKEEDYDKSVKKINELLELLGLSMEDTIRESYLCMLHLQHGEIESRL